jgi:hypothetical protein
VKIALEHAVFLLRKYAGERTPALAVVVTLRSVSIARVPGTSGVSIADGIRASSIVGKEDDTSDQLKFRLSDCLFEYDEFRAANFEDQDEGKFEALLGRRGRQRRPFYLFLNPEPAISTVILKAQRLLAFACNLVGENGNAQSSRHEVARARTGRRCLHAVRSGLQSATDLAQENVRSATEPS